MPLVWINSILLLTRNPVESSEARGWWADPVLQANRHQSRATDSIRQIHGVEIAQGLQG